MSGECLSAYMNTFTCTGIINKEDKETQMETASLYLESPTKQQNYSDEFKRRDTGYDEICSD